MVVTAGALDRRIRFRRRTLVPGPLGSEEVWSDHGSLIHAARHDISDAEKFAAGTILSQLTARFRVRHSSFTADLTPRDRLVCDGREWGIGGIKEVPEPRRRWLEITATRLPHAP